MAQTPSGSDPFDPNVSGARDATIGTPGAQGDASVTLGIGPGPQPGVPQAPASSMLTQRVQPMPQSTQGAVITHAEPQRRAHGAVTFNFLEDNVPRSVRAWPSIGLTRQLPSAQHNRVLELLDAATQSPDVQRFALAPHRQRLMLTVPDPQPGAVGSHARIPIVLEVVLNPPGYLDVVDTMVIGAGPDAVQLPVKGHRQFSSHGTCLQVLMPAAMYDELQLQALDERPRALRFAPRGSVCTVRYGFDGVGPHRGTSFDATLSLRYQAALEAWIVEAVGAEETAPPPLQLARDDIEWLTAEMSGPRLPQHITEEINGCLASYQHGVPLPEGVNVRPVTHGFRLSMDVLRHDPHASGPTALPQRWYLTLNLAQDGDRYVAALVYIYQSPQRTSRSAFDPFERTATATWRNPWVRSQAGSSLATSSIVSQGSAGTRRSLSPESYTRELPPARRLREPQPGEPPRETRAREQREGQQLVQELIELGHQVRGAALGADVPGTGGDEDDVFMSQQAYRAKHQLHEQTPVCAAVACSAALGFHVPFAELLRVNPQADREGTGALPLQALLGGFGRVSVQSTEFMELTGDTSAEVLERLQAHLQLHGHDAAVLLYRVDPLPGDAADHERSHHVAIYQEDGQWKLHDGLVNGGKPQPTTLDAAVRATFGSPAQVYGELEVLSFVRPPPGSGATSTAEASTALPAGQQAVDTRAGGSAAGGAGALTTSQLGSDLTSGAVDIRSHPMRQAPAQGLPVPPTGPGALRRSDANPNQGQTFIDCVDNHVPLLKPHLPRQPINQRRFDRTAAMDEVLAACEASHRPSPLFPYDPYCNLFEYTDVAIHGGHRVNVVVRFCDVQAGTVWDLKLYRHGRSRPHLHWSSDPG